MKPSRKATALLLPIALVFAGPFILQTGLVRGQAASPRNLEKDDAQGVKPRDEVDDLVHRMRPPQRFASHRPRFRVEKYTHTFVHASGDRETEYFVVKDGPRYVALIQVNGGTIRLLSHSPEKAPSKLELPRHRITLERSFGTVLRTDAYIPSDAEESFEFSEGGETLTLVRRYKGTTSFDTWSHKSREPETIDETNTFVFRCDPVFGYTIDGTYRTAVKPAPTRFEYFSAMTAGICDVWYSRDDVSRTVFTPVHQAGFEGWGLNFAAIDWCDGDKSKITCRDGGFGGYLNQATGWSPVFTVQGAEPYFVVCNAHADLDFVIPWEKSARTDADGVSHLTVKTRVLALPPEITRHVWDTMSMRFEGARRVMIRVGRLEDFEDQPLPVTSDVRGLTLTGGGPKISTQYAHSGTKSIIIPHGRFWPNLPQVPLEGGSQYRLGLDQDSPLERRGARGRGEEGSRADREAEGGGQGGQGLRGVRGARGLHHGRHVHFSSPHHGEWERRMPTSVAKPGEWQHVKLESEAEPWGPFLNIAFVASAGTAYVDDSELVEVPPDEDAMASRVVVTGRLLDVNGHTQVPRGLFGLHADSRLSEERARDWGVDSFRQIHFGPGSGSVAWDKEGNLREPFRSMTVVIDCQGDRYCPALCLTRPDYKEFFDRIGREYAQKCKDRGWKGYAEFWNEPYLNWAERSRKNYDPKYYDISKAEENGPVTIKGWEKPLKYLRWRRLWAQDEETGKINYLVPVPEGAGVGDRFEHELKLYFMPKGKRDYTVVEKWDVDDPTAVSYWSGKQNYDFYMWMFLPWARAIKETNPEITVIGGWDFHINSEEWKAWELLYKPMIDESIEWLDGVTEHHYGSDTRMTTATYEVVVGYAWTEHGKWLHCYNTETAGCVDPSVPGNRHGNATPYGAFNYGLRDIVELIYRSPDKAVSRAAHGSLAPGWGGGGDEFRFKLLKDFRGELVLSHSDDLQVWPAACVNGEQLVVVLFNDHSADRTVDLKIDAPAGTELAGGKKTWVVPLSDGGPLEFREETMAASGRSFTGSLTIPEKTGVKLSFPLEGDPPREAEILRRQFFARGVLREVRRGAPVSLEVSIDPALLERAVSARIKVVLEDARDGEGTLHVNEESVQVPDHDWLTEIPVEPSVLKPVTKLIFDSSGDGYRMDVASIEVDCPVEESSREPR